MKARRAPRSLRHALAHASAACASLAIIAAALASVAACGAASSPDVGFYAGSWLRVDGGEPNPRITLTVERDSDGATVTFRASDGDGPNASAAVTMRDGYLACDLPARSDVLDGATGLQLSLDQDGQLVVDKVLTDGTTEPVWIYERPPAAASPPATAAPAASPAGS